ncbi:MAG TPA: ABC transporter permease [Gemmatimonadales bacterium]
MSLIHSELRSAARRLRRTPGFTILATLTLGLGIGATATLFGAVRAVLLRPLPLPRPNQLVQLGIRTQDGEAGFAFSPPDFTDLRQEGRSFTEIAAINDASYALSGDGPAEQITAANVTGGYFALLGARPLHGRFLIPGDDVPGNRVVVLGHGLWQRRYRADPAIVGRTIRLDGQSYEVVGVMPRDFAFPLEAWVPLTFSADDLTTQRGAHYLTVIGRLREGTSLEQARTEVDAIGDRLASAYPNSNRGSSFTAVPLQDALVGDLSDPLVVLGGAVGLVLLLACVNVAGLLLVRGLGRRTEFAIRSALGATAPRLVRHLMAESLLLGLLGGTLGALISVWGSSLLAGLTSAGIPLLERTRVDAAVVAVTFLLAITTGLLFGAVPAWRLANLRDLVAPLKEEVRSVGGDPGSRRLRGALVVAEISLATVLLAGAGLLLRSLLELVRTDLGFATDRALSFSVSLPAAGYPTPAARTEFVRALGERLEALPGVETVGMVFGLPLTGFGYGISGYELDGRVLSPEEWDRTSVQIRVATPGYFRAMGIGVRQGRGFEESDRAGVTPVTVVSEAAARLLWPGGDPMGHRFIVGTRFDQGGERAGGQVVGVVADVRERGPAAPIRPTIYVAHAQQPVEFFSVVLRGEVEPSSLVSPARAALAALDRDLPMFQVRTLEQLAGDAVAQPRLYAILVGSFAAVALLLAGIGVYGIVAQTVASRTREIGVRLALGASREAVLGMVFRQGAKLTLAGLGFGLAAAAGTSGLITGLLHGVEPVDPWTYAAVALLLGLVAATACLAPARRAARLDPGRTLREG